MTEILAAVVLHLFTAPTPFFDDLSLLPILFFAFLLGMRHAADVDHVLAMSTLVDETTPAKQACRLGVLWGIGHSLSVLVFGLLFMLLRDSIPARLDRWLEGMVGGMLMVLGALAVRHARRYARACRQANSARKPAAAPVAASRGLHRRAPLLVGMVHGLAGSAGLALLALTAVPGLFAGIAYLLLFGFGSISGMIALALVLSVPFALVSRRLPAYLNFLHRTAGWTTLLYGLWMIIGR